MSLTFLTILKFLKKYHKSIVQLLIKIKQLRTHFFLFVKDLQFSLQSILFQRKVKLNSNKIIRKFLAFCKILWFIVCFSFVPDMHQIRYTIFYSCNFTPEQKTWKTKKWFFSLHPQSQLLFVYISIKLFGSVLTILQNQRIRAGRCCHNLFFFDNQIR